MAINDIQPTPGGEPELNLLLSKDVLDESLWKSLVRNINDFFFPKKQAPLAPAGLQVAGWVAIALGAGALAAGAGFSGSGNSQLTQAQASPSASSAYAGQRSGNESVGLGMGTFGLGSLLAVGGVSLLIVYFTHQPPPSAAPAKSGTVTTNGRALAISF